MTTSMDDAVRQRCCQFCDGALPGWALADATLLQGCGHVHPLPACWDFHRAAVVCALGCCGRVASCSNAVLQPRHELCLVGVSDMRAAEFSELTCALIDAALHTR